MRNFWRTLTLHWWKSTFLALRRLTWPSESTRTMCCIFAIIRTFVRTWVEDQSASDILTVLAPKLLALDGLSGCPIDVDHVHFRQFKCFTDPYLWIFYIAILLASCVWGALLIQFCLIIASLGLSKVIMKQKWDSPIFEPLLLARFIRAHLYVVTDEQPAHQAPFYMISHCAVKANSCNYLLNRY